MKPYALLFLPLFACSADAFTASPDSPFQATLPDGAPSPDAGAPSPDAASQTTDGGTPLPDSSNPTADADASTLPDSFTPPLCSPNNKLASAGYSSQQPSASCQGSTPWGCEYTYNQSWISQCVSSPAVCQSASPNAATVECATQADCGIGSCFYAQSNAGLGDATSCTLTLAYSGEGSFAGTTCASKMKVPGMNPLICQSDADCFTSTHCYPVTIPGAQVVKFSVCQ